MGTMSAATQKMEDRIRDEFDMIQESTKEFDISQHLATIDDLPDLGQIEIYDYDSDLTIASQKGMDVVESLVDLYLGDFSDLKKHPYIRNKMKEDALVYAETYFLTKMTRKNFVTQMRQVDNGDNSARMHEVINQTIGQIRENAKFSSTQKTELEKFYKEFRNDLLEVENSLNKTDKESDDGSQIVDNKKMNDMIETARKLEMARKNKS